MVTETITDVTLHRDEAFIAQRLRERFSRHRYAEMRADMRDAVQGLSKVVSRRRGFQLAGAEPGAIALEQQREVEAWARIRTLQHALEGLDRNLNQDPGALLQAIRALPYVTDVGLYFNSFCVRIRATYVHKGVGYDLGDWLLLFPNYWVDGAVQIPAFFESWQLACDYGKDWPNTGYPNHGLIEHQERREPVDRAEVNDHVRKGNLLAAIILAASLIMDVDPKMQPIISQHLGPVYRERLGAA